jgi:chromosome segregation ATPase
LKSKDIGNDEFNEKLNVKDKEIEMLTDQIADLKEGLKKKPSQSNVEPEKTNGVISKSLLEELQKSLNKVKRQNDELKKKLDKYEKKDKKKKGGTREQEILDLKDNTSAIHLESLSGPDSLKKVAEELTNKLNKSKSQIKNLKQQLNAVQNIPTDTLPQGDAEGKLKIQREMASFLQQQLDESKHALKTKEEEIATIKNEAIRIKRKYEELDNQIKAKDQKTNEIKADLDLLRIQTQTQTHTTQTISPAFNLRLKELESLVEDLKKQNIQQRLEISQLRKSN